MKLKNIKHPMGDYTTSQAVELARICRQGIGAEKKEPLPTIDEAIRILKDSPTMKSCNWITGQVALETLRLTKGEKVEQFV
jgi:hypothetical protein